VAVQGTISAGDMATLEIETRKDWLEPNVPKTLRQLWRLPSEDPRPMEGDRADGALGMGSLGRSNHVAAGSSSQLIAGARSVP
jgi:hypothetical protein